MKETPKDDVIFQRAATPKETEFTNQVYEIALGRFGGDFTDFDRTWQRFLLEFRQWSTQFSGQNVSMLHLRLGFLQMLLTHFPSLSALRTDPRIMDLVLAGCRMVGDKVVDPRFGECEIMQRSIGDRFGVLYTLRTSDGSLVSFEFFD
jgi:hypothetical protein